MISTSSSTRITNAIKKEEKNDTRIVSAATTARNNCIF